MTRTPRVIVVGGGLAGLVAARHLAAGGADVTLFEREETPGGRVRTREGDGFRLDRGFQVLFTAYPAVQRELDLDALDLRRFAPGATIARPNHRSTLSDPIRDPAALPATLFNPDVSLGDKLRVARLRWDLLRTDPDAIFDGTEPDDVSIDAFLRDRGFSDRFVERFAAPFYGGITLDRSLSTSKRVFEYTFRALAAGDTAVPAAGMGAIPEQLAETAREAGAAIETGIDVADVAADRNADGAGGTTVTAGEESIAADAVVVATDPPTARDLTGVESIPTEARACVTQYYELPARTDLETGRRLLLNATETGPNHVVPHSAVAPEYAPDDATLISATYLGEREERDEELADRTRDALAGWYPERRFDGFETLHTDRIEFAQFAQPPGIHDRLPDPRDPAGPIYLAGDYTRWSSIQGAMESGRQAAKAVIDDLSR
ncbi:NAD(P)/FAD-dependent oxidoreductase [Halosolutus amylolyticus]|uniref:NAD(P)/FAD-dependent oxidoreductase n=1 Tax=Halosolutus amylolyticus TaxID=2932267 RepID=A0ABD5PUX1_9EURY|nr:NAD(P)/FAD-dependent oxidoreductase [Halosolutus amylolyticus]